MSEQKEMSLNWDERIKNVANVIGKSVEETEAILDSAPYHINRENGIDLLDDEEATPFGDLRHLFCEKNGIPLPKLRLAIKFLRGKTVAQNAEVDPLLAELQSKFGIKMKLSDLDTEQLLPYYNPRKKNIIHSILEDRYGKYSPFIAFKSDGPNLTVAIEETLNYIADREQGFDAQTMIDIDGELEPLFGVGEYPSDVVIDEDPFAINVPLKRGRSTVNRVNWEKVNKEERQFFRLLWERGEITINSAQDRLVISQLLQKNLDELKRLFPETYVTFKHLKKIGKLPSLLGDGNVKPFNTYTNKTPFAKTTSNRVF